MIRTKHTCNKCNRDISASNYARHTNSCTGPKKVRGIDFDPNGGFKTGTRTQWNKGKKIGPNLRLKEQRKIARHAADIEELAHGSRRRRIIEEQDSKCLRCGNSHWLGEEIKFELNHIDGNNQNNKRENLEILCPNCHSLTPTWRGRKPVDARNYTGKGGKILNKKMRAAIK